MKALKNRKDIHKFAKKYLILYKDPMTPIDVVEESVFGEECTALGFKADQGKGFSKAYSKGAYQDWETLELVIFQIEDPLLLGSGIYSRWLQVTEHSLSEYVLDDKNLPWFLLALKRLKQLTKKEEKLAQAMQEKSA